MRAVAEPSLDFRASVVLLVHEDQAKHGFLSLVWGGFCYRYLAGVGSVLFLLQDPF